MKEPISHPSDLLNELDAESIEHLNKYHDHPSKNGKYAAVRSASSLLMRIIAKNCPPCADRIAAINSVRLARMWANSAIALEQVE
jgi:hypothetical protein